MLKGLKLTRSELGKINTSRKLDSLGVVDNTTLVPLHFLL